MQETHLVKNDLKTGKGNRSVLTVVLTGLTFTTKKQKQKSREVESICKAWKADRWMRVAREKNGQAAGRGTGS